MPTDTKDNSPKPLPASPRAALFILIIIAFLFVMQEVVFRLVFPVPEVVNFNRMEYSQLGFSDGGETRYLQNASFTWASGPDGVENTHALNLYGFRDDGFCLKKAAGKERVLFIGDSFTEGFMASDDETIPDYFASLAAEDGLSIEALNMGVASSDIPEYLKLMRDAVPLFNPDDLIMVFYANDFPVPPFELGEALTPEYSSLFVPRLYYVVKNMLSGKIVARRWRAKPFPFFAPVPSPLNPLSNEEYAAKVRRFADPLVLTAMEEGRFNPFAVDEFDKFKKYLRAGFDFRTYLKSIKGFAESKSARLRIVYIPSRSQVSDAYLENQALYTSGGAATSLTGEEYQLHARLIGEAAADLNVPFLDLTPKLKAHEARGERLYWDFDEHMRPTGYEAVGRYIFEWWRG